MAALTLCRPPKHLSPEFLPSYCGGPRGGWRAAADARAAHPRAQFSIIPRPSRAWQLNAVRGTFLGGANSQQTLLSLQSFRPGALRPGSQPQRRRTLAPPSASLFGVGAPEALVIGVVALIVFGPKGLAEVARNLGKTLRTFQPTIRELQEVTREFRDTLQQEIGLDELQQRAPPPPPISSNASTSALPSSSSSSPSSPTPTSPPPSLEQEEAYSTEDYARMTEQQIKRSLDLQQVSEEAKRASEIAAWKGNPPVASPSASTTPPAPSGTIPATQKEPAGDAVKPHHS